MTSRLIDLALRKQRLQMRSATLRRRWMADAAGLKPVCHGIDRVGDGLAWLRRHPQALVAAGVALLVARPRALLRWARRGFFAWQAYRRLRGWLAAGPAVH